MAVERIDLYGVPSSMGGYAPGQERAPDALRRALLPRRLAERGYDVRDHGDTTVRRWFPDRDRPDVQHVSAVARISRETTERVADSADFALVLGGDCTVGLGTVGGIRRRTGGRIGILYFDLHADIHVPSSMREGALDSMVLSHGLGLPGTELELVHAFDPAPLLDPGDVWLFAFGAGNEHERAEVAHLDLWRTAVEVVAEAPEDAAASAIETFAAHVDHVVVHLDIDVIDYMDLALSENADRNRGLTLDATMRALRVFLAHPSVTALTLTELNPDHDPDGSHIVRFVDALVDAFPNRGMVPTREHAARGRLLPG